MNDQILMDNYLLILKSTVEVYVHGTLESSNKEIKDLLKNGLNSTLNHQERVYNKMTEHGWYQIQNIEKEAITKVLNKITSGN